MNLPKPPASAQARNTQPLGAQPIMAKPLSTRQLIDWLATDSRAHPAAKLTRRLGQSAAILLLAVAIGLVTLLGFWGLNPHLTEFMQARPFQTKMAWLGLLAAMAVLALWQLASPMPRRTSPWSTPVTGIGLLLAAMLIAAVWQMPGPQADATALRQHWLGSSWATCVSSIIALSLPLLAVVLTGYKHLSATPRPALAGAAAGLLAATLGASLYSLHCTETSFGFYALWYGLGLMLMMGLGTGLGRWVLRW